MAKSNKDILLKYQRKLAELGTLDNEINNLDMTLPEGEGEKTFDYLAQKRQEIEEDIRLMREKVELITAWAEFKENGPWSHELRTELDNMDESIGNIATGEPGGEAEEPISEEPPLEPEGEVPARRRGSRRAAPGRTGHGNSSRNHPPDHRASRRNHLGSSSTSRRPAPTTVTGACTHASQQE